MITLCLPANNGQASKPTDPESSGRNWSRKVRETPSSSSQKRSERGQEVLAARPVGYPWSEQMSRKLSRKVRETPSSSSQKRSEPAAMRGQGGSEHGGVPWFSSREGSSPAGWRSRVRRACDDAPLSVPVRLCDAPYLLSGVRKASLAPNLPLATVLPLHAPCRQPEIGFVFPARFRLYLF